MDKSLQLALEAIEHHFHIYARHWLFQRQIDRNRIHLLPKCSGIEALIVHLHTYVHIHVCVCGSLYLSAYKSMFLSLSSNTRPPFSTVVYYVTHSCRLRIASSSFARRCRSPSSPSSSCFCRSDLPSLPFLIAALMSSSSIASSSNC